MSDLSRREALKTIAALFQLSLIAPISRLLHADIEPGQLPASPVFTDTQRALVSVVSERIIPTTDTPGAIAAKVPEYIETMLGEWFSPEERQQFLVSLESFADNCQKQFGHAFSDLSVVEQDKYLATYQQVEPHETSELEFFESLRQLVITGYYTSEIGMTVERTYLAVPGRYDGRLRYDQVKTIYSY